MNYEEIVDTMKNLPKIWLVIFAVLLLSMLVSPTLMAQDTVSDEAAHKALLLAFWEAEAARDYDRLDEFFTPDFVRHSVATSAVMPPAFAITNRTDYRQFLRDTAVTFPDYYSVPGMLVVEGDYAAFYGLFVGTFAENGNQIEVPIMGFVRFEDNLIDEMWVEWDNLTWNTQMMAQPMEYAFVPITGIDDLVGVWRIYGNGWAWFAEFTADGMTFIGHRDCASDVCAEHEEFTVEGNQIRFLSSQMHPQCQDATYNVFKVMAGDTQVGLRYEPVGEDCHPERSEALDPTKIIYPILQ
jgi:hypothetical protein